ncbi:MAG: MmcQ/YjbR family DNA-binding protein [Candidatus Eremiobacteraeota bacterium]|nr:MmcQ/YjbR family DNA-binding protein [Candidatus Eremiobacteraeota bacterium]
MATWDNVRRIVLELPESAEKRGSAGTATWTVRGKPFAWERPLRRSDLEALGEAAPAGAILGVRTPNLEMKDALLLSDPAVFFTTPHFDGYAAVLIVLAKIRTATLRDVLVESWLARAPKRVADTFLAGKNVAPRQRTGKPESRRVR